MGNFAQHVVGVVLALCAACSSSGTEAPPVGSGHGQCALRAGTYRTTFTLRDGSCGPQQEGVGDGTQPPAGPVTGCSGPGIGYSSDNCNVSFDTTCPNDAIVKGGSIRENGTSKWSVDASYGTALIQLSLFNADGTAICIGTYDAVLTRQ